MALHRSIDRPFGLLHLLNLPAWLELTASFLLMDLAFYYWHLANHRAPFLWRFHNVHHTDPDLDVSTAFRFHFGEIALLSAFGAIQISLTGISPWAFAVYQLAFQSEVLFHHGNVRLPIRFERLLSNGSRVNRCPFRSQKYAQRKVRTQVRPLFGMERMITSPPDNSRARLLTFQRHSLRFINANQDCLGDLPPFPSHLLLRAR